MFAKFIKWLSIVFTVLLFTVMVLASVQSVLTNPAAQAIFGIVVGFFLFLNGINELLMMWANSGTGSTSGITYGPGMEKHLNSTGMVIRDGKLEAQSKNKD